MPRGSLNRSDLERHLSALAQLYGWRHHKVRRVGLTLEGFVDGFPTDVLVRGGRLIFVTLSVNGSLTPAERHWQDELSLVTDIKTTLLTRVGLSALTRMLAEPSQHTAIGESVGER